MTVITTIVYEHDGKTHTIHVTPSTGGVPHVEIMRIDSDGVTTSIVIPADDSFVSELAEAISNAAYRAKGGA